MTDVPNHLGVLAEALIRAQAKFKPLKRSKTNPRFGSKYATLDDVIESTREALASEGLVVIQPTEGHNLVSHLVHTSGASISGSYPLNPLKEDPQAVGAAMTYARRYAYSALVGIAPEDDLDGEDAKTLKDVEKPAPQTKNPPAFTESAFYKALDRERKKLGDKQFFFITSDFGFTPENIAEKAQKLTNDERHNLWSKLSE